MQNKEKKLNDLYSTLDVMEGEVPEADEKSRKLIDNLRGLSVSDYPDGSVEEAKKIDEIPENVDVALTNLKETIKLLNFDIEDETVKKFKTLESFIDEFINVFNELKKEKDRTRKAELTVRIKEIYNGINTCLKI